MKPDVNDSELDLTKFCEKCGGYDAECELIHSMPHYVSKSSPESQQNKELRDEINEAIWPYGKPYPISAVLSRGIDERIFQMPMSTLVAGIEVLIDRAVIDKLYSLITPIWGDKNWDEDDKYVLNLKGSDILKHIKELEANLRSKGSE